ncbi:alanine dehydrogenase [Anaeromyxobacter paludicola]|uniref:Alanine dehydrogenase n=1 Tax=Anaeromyxobacter paludicola TaxID=2918171 RepID=A0ABN6N9A6_9BACT|nr:alanine dehydrogenase [Anaeromyxobacter paludicola]BDG09821.1 alanine dehydrogenase [Anaeromyxobacter paludicola]
MNVGCPKEIKVNENRVGLTPGGARSMVAAGHKVLVQAGAGVGSGFPDAEYAAAGAVVVKTAQEVFDGSELVIKVKEPQAVEISAMHVGQVLFTYLHLAPDPEQTKGLLEKGITGIAYETITDAAGRLPLLTPMSEVAGRMAAHVGAFYLQAGNGGSGVLMGGVPGVPPANVVVLGAGTVGLNAIKVAAGMGARVTALDKSLPTLRYLDDIFGNRIDTLWSSEHHVEEAIAKADLVIGAVLVPGAHAPRIVTRKMLSLMKPRSVVVDVAVDQGGCFETTHATTHADPVYLVDNVLHYAVANMPGAVPRTSTIALANATLPYALKLANQGWKKALAADKGFLAGLNTHDGKLTCAPVAESLGLPFVDPASLV